MKLICNCSKRPASNNLTIILCSFEGYLPYKSLNDYVDSLILSDEQKHKAIVYEQA